MSISSTSRLPQGKPEPSEPEQNPYGPDRTRPEHLTCWEIEYLAREHGREALRLAPIPGHAAPYKSQRIVAGAELANIHANISLALWRLAGR